MAGIDKCLPKLQSPEIMKELFGDQDVPQSALKKLAKDIDDLKTQLEKSGKVNEVPREVRKFIQQRRELSMNEKRTRLLNLNANRKAFEFVTQQGFKDNAAEGVKTMLEKGTTLANGGADSVMHKTRARMADYIDVVEGQLSAAGVDKYVIDGFNDKDIRIAKEALANDKPLPADFPKEAITAAKIINQYHEMAYQEKLNVGATTKKRQGYTGPQEHSAKAVGAVDFETWKSHIVPLLDEKFTFGNITDAGAREKFLKSNYNAIRAGEYGQDMTIADAKDLSDFKSIGKNRNIDRELSETRTLHFKNAEAYNDYAKTYGFSEAQTLTRSMEKNARKITLMEKFGTNPPAAFEGLLERVESYYKRTGKPDAAKKFAAQKDRLKDMFKQVAHTDMEVGNETVAVIGSTIRSLQSVSKLGNVPFRSLANAAGQAVSLRGPTGRTLVESSFHTATEWVRQIPEGRRATFAKTLEKFMEDEKGAYMERTTMGRVDGGANKVARFMHKWGGADLVNNTTEFAVGNQIMSPLSDHSAKPWNQLAPGQQAYLLEAGFKEADWAVLGKAIEVAPDGRNMMTPAAIKKLSDEDIKAVMKENGARGSISSYRNDMALKFRAAIIQQTDIATTTAGVRESSRLNLGRKRGTWDGETLRLLTQFKSFTAQSLNISKRILNGTPDQALLAQGVLQSARGGGDYAAFGAYAIGTTSLALTATFVINALNGKKQPGLKDPGTWLKAVGQSGMGGMHADLFVGEWNKYSFIEAAAGPTAGTVAGGVKVGAMMREALLKGENPMTKEAKKETVKLLRSHTPFQNVPLLSGYLNKVQVETIGEMVDPGSASRAKARQIRQEGK